MSVDLPEPRVVPTPTFSPRMNLMMAVTLAFGATSLVIGLSQPSSAPQTAITSERR
jgi:hypothetical protein